MTTDDKLKHFMDVSMQTAVEKKSHMIDEYKTAIDEQFESFKADMTAKYELQEKTEIEELRRDLSKEFSLEKQHVKRKLTHKKDELTTRLFDEVTEKLNAFLASDDYISLLEREIAFSLTVAPEEPITIYIDPLDEDKKASLEAKTGATLTVSDYSFGQGMRAVIPSKNILIDYSFDTKLHEIRDEYILTL